MGIFLRYFKWLKQIDLINSEIKKIRHWIKKSSLRKNEIRENNSNIKSWSI